MLASCSGVGLLRQTECKTFVKAEDMKHAFQQSLKGLLVSDLPEPAVRLLK